MNDDKPNETPAMQDAAYDFVNALCGLTKLDNDGDTAKIVIYGRHGVMDTITFCHNGESKNNYEFLARKNNDRHQFVAVLKGDPDTVFDCRLLSHDTSKDLFIFLMKPEFTQVIENNDELQPDAL